MTQISITFLFSVALLTTAFYIRSRAQGLRRLKLLDSSDSFHVEEDNIQLAGLSGRLGKAGLYTPAERREFWIRVIVLSTLFTALAYLSLGLIGVPLGAYLSALLSYAYLCFLTKENEREILYRLPLVLESFILLVESGLGILPAIEKLISNDKSNPVLRVLSLAYMLSARGLPFNKATGMVAEATQSRALRHVLLHLDISGSEGGELIPSLQNLATHAHREWTQSVRFRIKRLEQAVVFPVFVSVLGLLLLAAAGPLATVLDFKDSLKTETLDR